MYTRHIVVTGIAALFSAHGVSAQSTSASAPITASVTSGLAISVAGTTQFGTFNNTAHEEVLLATNPGMGRSAAQFTVTSDANRSVNFSCMGSTAITLVGGSSTMLFTPNFAIRNNSGVLTETPLACSGFAQSSTTGSHLIGLGGRLVVNNNQAVGSYTGTFTLSVSY